MANDLAFVLVHGAWHTPSHWGNVTTKLREDGYQVETPQLPSSNKVAVDDVYAKDIAVVKEAIRNLTSKGKNVIVVLHSYAGKSSRPMHQVACTWKASRYGILRHVATEIATIGSSRGRPTIYPLEPNTTL